jgi:hypothetical protein
LAWVRPTALATEFFKRLRKGPLEGRTRGGVKVPDLLLPDGYPAVPSGGFREVRIACAPPEVACGICLVLPGGLRIEGLDVAGAAALARVLR